MSISDEAEQIAKALGGEVAFARTQPPRSLETINQHYNCLLEYCAEIASLLCLLASTTQPVETTDRVKPAMAKFEIGHRLQLPGGIWISKRSDDAWDIWEEKGGPTLLRALGLRIGGHLPVGPGGSMDSEVARLVTGINEGSMEDGLGAVDIPVITNAPSDFAPIVPTQWMREAGGAAIKEYLNCDQPAESIALLVYAAMVGVRPKP